jgi:Ricin-type beta-trefoil lectin domain/Putative Ig domain
MRGFLRGGRGAAGWVIALAASGSLVAGLATAATVASAGAATQSRPLVVPRAPALPANERAVCARPTQPGQMQCQAILLLPGRHPSRSSPAFAAPAFRLPGYGPSNLQSAYRLAAASAHRGRGETVAIVDAYSNPDVARDLAVYRSHFGLPACTTVTGCLRIVNQVGRAGPLPRADIGWGIEESIDLDMVSAICPRCRIVLVEAKSPLVSDLGAAEDTAARLGARFVSDSWSGREFPGQNFYDHFFNHPGDALVVASGDSGYGALFPTDTQYVTAVGGTTLRHRRSGGRPWTESVWGSSNSHTGTGSGCSSLEAKPSWQGHDAVSPTGCLSRTENDVAAVANPNTGVTVDDTYGTGAVWGVAGGTSVATPIITAIYALAGKPARGTYPASYLYRHPAAFNDVTTGANGRCERNRPYLCSAKRGYDGPTGLGTPKGTAGFSSRGVQPVTVLDPGTQDGSVSAPFKLTVRAVDSDGAARSLSYRATGLPSGLKVTAARRSLDGMISGRLPATPGSYHVTVTAKDNRTGRTGSTHFSFYVIRSLAASAPSTGYAFENDTAGACLYGQGGATTPGTPVLIGPCTVSTWAYVAGARPGQAGKMRITAGICLGLAGTNAVLQTCNGARGQVWDYQSTYNSHGMPTGYLFNPASGRCLNGQQYAEGTRVVASSCSSAAFENWVLTGQSLRSGVPGQCASFSGTPGQKARSAACTGAAVQAFALYNDLIVGISDQCFDVHGMLDNAAIMPDLCSLSPTGFSQQWLTGPGGELINSNSGKCLDDPGPGQPLVQDDCYGLPGEIWGIN